jgi:hypothetical protein
MNNILILMSDNRGVSSDIDSSDYNSLTSLINLNYAKKHNYDFLYLNPLLGDKTELLNCFSPTNELRHSAWSKLLSMIKIISEKKDYDYIVYVDSDCIFYNQSLTVMDYLTQSKNISSNSLDFNSDIIFMNNQPWQFSMPCSGFFIVRPNISTLNFFKKWYINNNEPKYNTKHIWEQYCLHVYLLPNEKISIEIIDDWMFREKKNQFLRHIGSEEKNNRISFFKEYISNNFSKKVVEESFYEIKHLIESYNTIQISNTLI